MEADFWHERWQGGRTAFHNPEVHPLLRTYFPAMTQEPGARVFVPLCGKTVDIPWLLEQGCVVIGSELSELAVEQLFEAMEVVPVVTSVRTLKRFTHQTLTVFAGDIFELLASDIGQVDLVYDRAALIALPTEMRKAYAAHLRALTGTAPQLLITLDYDQAAMSGPPFSVPEAMIAQEYAAHYRIEPLWAGPVTDALKERVDATERSWRLVPH